MTLARVTEASFGEAVLNSLLRCKFCGAIADGTCAWPVMQRSTVYQAEVNAGDTMYLRYRGIRGKAGRFTTKVLAVNRFRYVTNAMVTVVGFLDAGGKRCHLLVNPGVLAVDRPAPCAIPCCSLHRREPNDGLSYCMNHWQAWEQVS